MLLPYLALIAQESCGRTRFSLGFIDQVRHQLRSVAQRAGREMRVALRGNACGLPEQQLDLI